ncbi:MAG: monofunctional biosynthetic peptidoglycan transglycosylase [Sphingobacteriales bacterium]|nr:MAG: monofunctional biosynthetic peptidoglycan transglycosylase [Sphingobacteriales bacterium]
MRWVLKLIAGFMILSFVWALLYKWMNPPVTATMISRKISVGRAGKDNTLTRKWVKYENISPYMVLAVIATEDQNFLEHHGFDFEAIGKAMEHNQRQAKIKRKKIKGASTISQQVAKNVFLWERRSWLRKGLEAYFTVLIELLWSKKRIMEVYLNIAETGNLCFGVEGAANKFFGKKASALTKEQAALIASVLPAPSRNNLAKPNRSMLERKEWAMRQMNYLGDIELVKQLD